MEQSEIETVSKLHGMFSYYCVITLIVSTHSPKTTTDVSSFDHLVQTRPPIFKVGSAGHS